MDTQAFCLTVNKVIRQKENETRPNELSHPDVDHTSKHRVNIAPF